MDLSAIGEISEPCGDLWDAAARAPFKPFGRQKMSRTKSILAIAAATTMFGAAAKATVTASGLTLVPHVAGAEADDPNLANYCTYDLQVNITGTLNPTTYATGNPGVNVNGDRWLSTDLRAILTMGNYYVPPVDDAEKPNPAFWGSAGIGERFLEDDTFITSDPGTGVSRAGAPLPRFDVNGYVDQTQHGYDPNKGVILGGAQFPPPSSGATETFNATTVDVSYGDTGASSRAYHDGTYTIARLTVLIGSKGTVVGDVGSKTATQGIPFSFNIGGVVPEPTSLALMGLGLGTVAIRRRK